MKQILKLFFTLSVLAIKVRTQNVPGVCTCVPIGTCSNGTGGGTGNGFVNVAINFNS